jgi:uncharacterized protein YpmS
MFASPSVKKMTGAAASLSLSTSHILQIININMLAWIDCNPKKKRLDVSVFAYGL